MQDEVASTTRVVKERAAWMCARRHRIRCGYCSGKNDFQQSLKERKSSTKYHNPHSLSSDMRRACTTSRRTCGWTCARPSGTRPPSSPPLATTSPIRARREDARNARALGASPYRVPETRARISFNARPRAMCAISLNARVRACIVRARVRLAHGRGRPVRKQVRRLRAKQAPAQRRARTPCRVTDARMSFNARARVLRADAGVPRTGA